MLHAILALLGIAIGAALADWMGAITGLAIGVLSASVLRLGTRVRHLESAIGQSQSSTPVAATNPRPVADLEAPPVSVTAMPTEAAAERVRATDLELDVDLPPPDGAGAWSDSTPVTEVRAAAPSNPSPATPRRHREPRPPDFLERAVRAAKDFFTGGNLVVRVGLVVLFFGVAFLLRYAAEQNVFPIQLRVASVTFAALVMFVLGWRLRPRRSTYGLILQGGAVGILYLTVFASAQRYHLIELGVAFALMALLVAASGALALVQNSRALATMGAIGGFLAPILCSSGSGDHVTLFSYYAILNAGILAIAWFKTWRSLNLIAFVFTFVVATLWGVLRYRAHHFSSTEPFLILFFLFFVGISVLYALRQPPRLKGLVDSTLVFGTPVVCFSLQAALVHTFEYGLAWSAAGMGGFYLLLAFAIRHVARAEMQLLREAFLALGVVFASLAVPFALDGHWTAVTWALEGAAMVWVGVRQQRVLARTFGLLLQFGSGAAFAVSWALPFTRADSSFFFGTTIMTLAALVSSYTLYAYRDRVRRWEKYLHVPVLAWGLCWWFGGSLHEVDARVPDTGNNVAAACLALFVLSFAALSKLGDWLRWSTLRHPPIAVLPIATLITLATIFDSASVHLLSGWGWLVWPAALTTQYWLMYRHQGNWHPTLVRLWQLGSYWLLIFSVTAESAWFVDRLLNETWTVAAAIAVPAAMAVATIHATRYLRWPLQAFETDFLGAGLALVNVAIALAVLAACFADGDPVPLRYVPVLNPMDISQILAMAVIGYWLKRAREEGIVVMTDMPAALPMVICGGLAFAWLNALIARTVHFWGTVPYEFDALFASSTFQAAIAITWSLLALTLMTAATRRHNRPAWVAGAVLLALVILKLFVVDLSDTGTVARIVSFLAVGVLMLIIGYFAPLPPRPALQEQAS